MSMIDVLTELVMGRLLSEMLYTDDLVLMTEATEGLRKKFWKWRRR